MGIFSSLQKVLGFTISELRAILFLAATFFLGLGLRWFGANAEPPAAKFNYSAQDSIFLERSATVFGDSTKQEPARKSRNQPARKPKPHSINPNSASREELMLLPGIGRTYAERILMYRQEHGPFRSVEELSKVKGIGKKTLARIREFLYLDDSTSSKK